MRTYWLIACAIGAASLSGACTSLAAHRSEQGGELEVGGGSYRGDQHGGQPGRDAEIALCTNQKANVTPDTQIESCTRIIDSKPDNSLLLALAHSSRASAWYDKKDYPRALTDFDKAIELDPKTGLVHVRRGLAFSAAGDKVAAAADMEKGLSLEPENDFVRFIRGVYFMSQKQDDRAITEFTEAIQLEPEGSSASVSLRARGEVYMRKNDYAAALADFDRYVGLEPDDARGFRSRGDVHMAQKNFEAALKDFNEAIRLEPKTATNFNRRSFAWRDLGDNDKALADIETAALLDPGAFSYQHNRCSLRIQLDRELDIAIGACTEALRIAPGSHDVLSSRGVGLLKLGRLKEAKADFDACIGTLLLAQKDEDQARDIAFCRFGRAIATIRIEGAKGPNRARVEEDLAEAERLDLGVGGTFAYYGIEP